MYVHSLVGGSIGRYQECIMRKNLIFLIICSCRYGYGVNRDLSTLVNDLQSVACNFPA